MKVIKWIKDKVIKLFNDYISNILLIILSSFITYSLKYFKDNFEINNFKMAFDFLYPIVKFLLYLFISITIFLLLNLIRKLIIRRRHKKNLITSSMLPIFVSKQPMEIIVYDTKLFDIKFEVFLYKSNVTIYSEVNKFICKDCNGEIKFKEESILGDFKYLCRVCEKKLKYKYDHYTIRKKVESIVDSELRSQFYEIINKSN